MRNATFHESGAPPVDSLGNCRLRLRAGLVFRLRSETGVPYYVVEDSARGKFYRIGLSEYAFLSCLDGEHTIDDVLASCARNLGHESIDEADATRIVHWLIETELAQSPEGSSGEQLARRAAKRRMRRKCEWLNPFSMRIALGWPDRGLARLGLLAALLFSRAGFAAWLVLVGSGAAAVIANLSRFTSESHSIVRPESWYSAAVGLILLKLWHELCHALACKRFGGRVGQAGINFFLMAPLAYVDVSSAHRFGSRARRMIVSAAGIYGEGFIAAIAAWVWALSTNPLTRVAAEQVVILASVGTLLFNANPLMRFDGYYLLSDLLGIANLAGRGQQALSSLARRWVWGLPTTTERSHESPWVVAYAVAALGWRVAVCGGLVISCARWAHGAGVMLSIAGIVMWFAWPLGRALLFFCRGSEHEQPNRRRALAAVLGSAGLVSAALALLPAPGRVHAPGSVIYEPRCVVRAESPGFVTSVLVDPGQQVEQGELLAVLENQELLAELSAANAEAELAALAARSLLAQGKRGAHQAQLEKAEAARRLAAENQRQVDALQLRAPRAGQVIARDLESLRGRYLRRGDALVTLADESQKELVAAVAQEDVSAFSARIGRTLSFSLDGTRARAGKATLTRVFPGASLELAEPALAATSGGPLGVRRTQPAHGQESAGIELVAPRFTARLQLTPEVARGLRAGERVDVRTTAPHARLGAWLWNQLWRG